LQAQDPAIAAATDLAEDFLLMLRRREGERLPAWLDAAEASGINELARFAGRLRADRDAVQAGLTLRHSNGQTEGQVTKLKLVKRQGYGRAKVDLLRKRVLRAARRQGLPKPHGRPYPLITGCAGDPPIVGEA
jgi:transposase